MDGLLQKRGVRLSLLLAIVSLAIAGIYVLSDIFAPLLFSFLVAYMLDPVADALERRRFTRLAAVITIFLSLTLALTLFVGIAGYYLTRGVVDLYDAIRGDGVITEQQLADDPSLAMDDGVREFPENHPLPEEGARYYVDDDGDGQYTQGYLRWAIAKLDEVLEEEGDPDDPDSAISSGDKALDEARNWLVAARDRMTQDQKDEFTSRISENASWILGGPVRRIFGEEPPDDADTEDDSGLVGSLVTWVSWLLLCPLYIFYLLLEIDPIVARARKYLPGKHREMIVRIMGRIDRTMSAFFRGRLTICLLKGVGTAIGLAILGVPFAIPIGIAAGFLALIPYVGIWFAIVPSLLLVWLEYQSFGRLVGAGAVFAGMEVLEGFVMIPAFLGKEVGLHPLVVIVTMLIFAELLGFLGILLSVPLAAIAKILAEEFLLPLIESFAAEEPDPPPDGPSGAPS